MDDYEGPPLMLSDLHLDGYTSDAEIKIVPWAHRQRDKSNIITVEAPIRYRQRDKSNIITFVDPNVERSPSPSSRYGNMGAAREFERSETQRMAHEADSRRRYNNYDEVDDLRRLLREKEIESISQKAKIRRLEDEVRSLLELLKGTNETRPTYTKVHRKYMAKETLQEYRLPWEYDPNDREFIIIKKLIDPALLEELFTHTKELGDGEKYQRRLRMEEGELEREKYERRLRMEDGELERDWRQRARDEKSPIVVPLQLVDTDSDEAEFKIKKGIRRGSRGGASYRRRGADKTRSSVVVVHPVSDDWRVNIASESPRGDVVRPRPKGGVVR